ncbi:DUF6048 family protein [Alkalitalea saponilacus]|uniref:Outer membrane protein beta-barrel domain-containing protein n=1 Tax=Alkalitalea saponilacus TaxID=889453 RepID=A0A1T5HTF9_9BACT|nr:DUF6048 family protein [Alkalitalea saponilacus]SKC23977.1 hypothetical protein SAMN03080601_03265 [Alkalitalea saponilacus]
MEKIFRMFKYISISFFLLISTAIAAQINMEEVPRDPQGFTLGINLAGPFNRIMDNDRTGISFLTRINVAENLFFRGEAGFENVSFNQDAYSYDSNGTFLKAGIELNSLSKREPGTHAHLLFGIAYGMAIQEQSASRFTIENSYWPDFVDRVGSHTVNTHWVELSGGPRVEVFQNLYLGWSIHLRVSVLRDNPEMLKPYYVPGFGNGDNRLNGGFSYTIEYLIPWKK